MKTKTIRNQISKLITVAVASSLCFTIASPDSTDAAVFAKFEGIDGESKDSEHDKWIDVLSTDWGIDRPGGGASGQSRRRGSAVIEDVRCSKELDKASPKLQESCLTGEVIPQVEIHFTRTYGDLEVVYLKILLKKVLITGTHFHHDARQGAAGTSSEAVPTEDFSLNYEEIKVTYTQLDADGVSQGNVEFEWKVEEGDN